MGRIAETVRRFGGFVAEYMGDGVLVYFGYPHVLIRLSLGTFRIATALDLHAYPLSALRATRRNVVRPQ